MEGPGGGAHTRLDDIIFRRRGAAAQAAARHQPDAPKEQDKHNGLHDGSGRGAGRRGYALGVRMKLSMKPLRNDETGGLSFTDFSSFA